MPHTAFFDRIYHPHGLKIVNGFSRPLFHNIAGVMHGYKFDKRDYGGMIRHSEAGMLYLWSKAMKPGTTIVEIGCYGGLSTSYLASGIKDKGCKLFSIDPFNSDLDKQADHTDNEVTLEDKPTTEIVYERLRNKGLDKGVTLIEGYSQEVAKDWDEPIDFLWIDGNHDQAYQDFKDFEPFLNPGARVGFHDAHPRYGLKRVVDDVVKAINNDGWKDLEYVKSIITAVKTD